MSGRRAAWAALLAGASLACGGTAAPPFDPAPPGWQAALDRGLDYLEGTSGEVGLDVVVALQVVAVLADSPRAAAIADARRGGLRASDLERYGVLLDLSKPDFPPGSLVGVTPSATTPDPGMSQPDGPNLILACTTQILQCQVDEACRGFVAAPDRWGYLLTHQAVWVLFAHWAGCAALPVDLEERRRTFAANLIVETRADPAFTDLFAERLAMLGALGFGAGFEPAWVGVLLGAQEAEGCWRVDQDHPCHPHPTALALWALALARRAGRWPAATAAVAILQGRRSARHKAPSRRPR